MAHLFQPDAMLQDLLDRLHNNDDTLQEIQLYGAKISASMARDLQQALEHSTHVKKLDLRYCFVEGGVKTLVKALYKNISIRELSFQCCGVDDSDACELSNVMACNDTLRKLHVGVGCIMGKDGIRSIAEGLVVNKSLKEVDLSGSGIGDYGAFVLSMALQVNSSLQKLNLKQTLVTNVGLERIAAAMEHNTSLEILDLSHNLVKDESVAAMAQVLERRNTSLKHVLLTKKSPEQARVCFYTSQNRAGRGLLQDLDTPVSLAPMLLGKASHDPKALFGLLRELPHLWTTTVR